jgi:HlyD family secretion protein
MSAQLKSVPPVILREVEPIPASARFDRSPLSRWTLGRPRWVMIGASVAVIAVIAFGGSRLLSHKVPVAKTAPSQTISVGTAVQATMGRSLVVNGSLAAWDELPVGAEAGGLAITQVAVEEGDRVTKGQLLAHLDDSVLRAQLAQALASVAQAEAGVKKAEAMAATAASDVHRAKELSKNGFISGQVAEQRETTAATANADVNVARQTLATAKAVADERAAELAQTEIRAPTDGIVSKRSATLGNVVTVGQQLFRLIRDGRVELRAEVPEMDLVNLAAGQPATIVANDADPRRFEGKVRLIGATVDPQTRIGMVYIALPDDPALKPGMFVHGAIATGAASVLEVPEEAIVYKDGKPAIFVISADNRAKLRMVETGARLDGQVEIRSGVAAGEHVALAGAGYLKDNDLVRVEASLGGPTPLQPTASVPQSGAVR